MKILFISDIVGEPGIEIVENKLGGLVNDNNIGVVIANAENAAGGKGLTEHTAERLFKCGVNVITLGNHTFDKKDITDVFAKNENVIRPANYPPGAEGKGYVIYTLQDGRKLAVVNLLGRIFTQSILDCPFRKADEIVSEALLITKNIFVDMHGEASSEKMALAYYLDGRVSAVIGSHTHVQTSDERILDEGTAYLTDAGMTGPYDKSVIGMDKDAIIKRFVTGKTVHYVLAKGNGIMQGCIVDINESTGKAISIERFSYKQ